MREQSGGPGNTLRRGAFAAAAIFLVALCLRPPITTVGPLLPDISADFGLSESAQGVLGALPLLAFAAISPLVHRLATRWGTEASILAALLVLATAIVLRSWTGTGGLWVGTFVIGAAIAVGNVLVPVVVRQDYPQNIARATGAYSACITMSAAVASAIAVPLAAATDWRLALGVWAVMVLVIAAVWAPRVRGARHVELAAAVPEVPGSIWRQPTAWWITAFMGLQSTLFYLLITWLPTIEISRGVSAQAAGIHLSVLQGLGLVGGLSIPSLLRPGRDQRLGVVTASAPVLLAVVGMLVLPQAIWVWVVLAGLGQGAALVAALTLISIRGRTRAEATRLSGMAQSIGYLLASGGPIAAGYLAERTGAWTAPLVMMACLSAIQLLVGLRAGVDRRPEPA